MLDFVGTDLSHEAARHATHAALITLGNAMRKCFSVDRSPSTTKKLHIEDARRCACLKIQLQSIESMIDYATRNRLQEGSETDSFTESRYAQFARLLPPGQLKVLDVGCNTGRGGAVLKRLRPDINLYGLDLLQARLDRLPRDVYDGTVCGSATQVPSDDETYDAVVAGEFIEHLLPMDAHRFVADAFRVLKVRGRLLLTTPNPGNVKMRWRDGTCLGGAHLSQHHPDTLKIVLKMYGFARARVLGSGKVTWYLGDRFPWLSIYGSFLAVGEKV